MKNSKNIFGIQQDILLFTMNDITCQILFLCLKQKTHIILLFNNYRKNQKKVKILKNLEIKTIRKFQKLRRYILLIVFIHKFSFI